MTQKTLSDQAAEAVQHILENGGWQSNPFLSEWVAKRGVEALERLEYQAKEAAQEIERKQLVEPTDDIGDDGWSNDTAHAWRVVLDAGDFGTNAVVFFASEPSYATIKAFARAACVPVNQVQAEQRDNG